jgi:hypothetical protein
VGLDKKGALDKHTARAAGKVTNATVEWLNDGDQKRDDGGGGKELAAFLSLAHGEMAEEIFVNFPEGVTLDVHRNGVHGLEQFLEQGVLETVIGLGQHVFEVGVLRFDSPHRVVDSRADVGPFR